MYKNASKAWNKVSHVPGGSKGFEVAGKRAAKEYRNTHKLKCRYCESEVLELAFSAHIFIEHALRICPECKKELHSTILDSHIKAEHGRAAYAKGRAKKSDPSKVLPKPQELVPAEKATVNRGEVKCGRCGKLVDANLVPLHAERFCMARISAKTPRR